jgi:serine O-acetyltransferase
MSRTSFAEMRRLIRSDLWRYGGTAGFGTFWHNYWRMPGFRYSVWYRLHAFVCSQAWGRLGARQYVSWKIRRLGFAFGISLPPETSIGPGLYIGHHGGIVIHPEVRIGANVNLSHDVTIGLSSRGDRFGCPTLGNDVYIGPGAKLFGRITIGDRAAIGANAVVTRDVPADRVAVGSPARTLEGSDGSAGYISYTDY